MIDVLNLGLLMCFVFTTIVMWLKSWDE